MTDEIILGTTESVCPECLRRIPAQRIRDGEQVYMVKLCPEHGEFRVMVWQGEPSYESWGNTKIPSSPSKPATEVERGCPFDCGLCPDHRQQTCCVLLEITKRCNLQCPVCFASAENSTGVDSSLAEVESWYRMLLESGGPYNIQLSGGEPTLHPNLPEIISMGRELGFEFIQINTNGLRLAKEPLFVKQLKDAGLSCAFLQFDGTSDDIYQKIRGASLYDQKLAAIENCARYDIGVVLVPTLVPGINTEDIGKIIDFAIAHMPAVRGVHFQPISYFGRYPSSPPIARITIPDILRAIESQTNGRMRCENFLPPGAENAYCSFHGNFILMPDGKLSSWSSTKTNQCCTKPIVAAEGSSKSRRVVAKQWSAPHISSNASASTSCCNKDEKDILGGINATSFDDFLERVTNYTLSVSGMAFQDAWNLDLDRLRDCLIHVVSPDKKLIPFCAYNLTDKNGHSIYRDI